VEGAMVTFIPENGGGRSAHGRTGPDGSFQLTSTKPNDGVLRGDYKVIVTYQEGVAAPPADNVRDVFLGMQQAEKQPRKPPRYVIPTKYSDPSKTVLRQKVPPPDGKVVLALASK